MPRDAVILVLALLAPALAAADALDVDGDGHRPPIYMCGMAQGRYAPDSTYEANLRHLAATLPAKLNESSSWTDVLAGDRPNQIAASAFCNSSSSDCAACLAEAFRYAHRVCPYSRHATVHLDSCSLGYYDAYLMELNLSTIGTINEHTLSWWWDHVLLDDFRMVLVFQVMGFACALFMFLQEWRARTRGPANLLP